MNHHNSFVHLHVIRKAYKENSEMNTFYLFDTSKEKSFHIGSVYMSKPPSDIDVEFDFIDMGLKVLLNHKDFE